MKPYDKYQKICPTCEEEFLANHFSRVYCGDDCKSEAARAKKAERREKLSDRELDLSMNDKALKRLSIRIKQHYSQSDLESVHFDPKCYQHRFTHDVSTFYFIVNFVLQELPERIFKIHKCY
jgi:hypothetical protein